MVSEIAGILRCTMTSRRRISFVYGDLRFLDFAIVIWELVVNPEKPGKVDEGDCKIDVVRATGA